MDFLKAVSLFLLLIPTETGVMADKDFHIKEKQVDESWKDRVSSEKGGTSNPPADESSKSPKESNAVNFINFITSLAIQAMMHLGLIPPAEGKEPVINREAAKELIDLLVLFKDKTHGNLTADEDKLLSSAVADLQLKYVQLEK